MTASLDDAWARVEWAYRLLVRLQDLLDPFDASQPYEIREEISSDGTQRKLIAEHPQPAPEDVPFLLGDIVHALHSALDYVVCSAVEWSGHVPSTRASFPIARDENRFGLDKADKLEDVPAELVEVIDRVQPYHLRQLFEEHSDSPEEVEVHLGRLPLVRLHAMSIAEKHRALLVATTIFTTGGMWVGHNRPEGDASGVGFAMSRNRDRATITLPRDPTNPEEHFDPHFAAHVTVFDEGPDAMSVSDTARSLYNEVAHQILPEIAHAGPLRLTVPRQLPYAAP